MKKSCYLVTFYIYLGLGENLAIRNYKIKFLKF